MPPDVIEKIFNPFFTTKPTDQGTGLGLAISNDIVRRHGGAIRVTSEPGEFTEMIVELPLVAPTATAPEGMPEDMIEEGIEERVGEEAAVEP
jgi:signal transduction histidine kinase